MQPRRVLSSFVFLDTTGKRADYILYYKPNIPIALIEAKDNTHATGDGMQQGLDYAETLNIPSCAKTRPFEIDHKSAA